LAKWQANYGNDNVHFAYSFPGFMLGVLGFYTAHNLAYLDKLGNSFLFLLQNVKTSNPPSAFL